MNKQELARYLRTIKRRTENGEFEISRRAEHTNEDLGGALFEKLARLNVGSIVLEVGIGKGVTLTQLRERFPHLTIVGTNYDERNLFNRKQLGGTVKAEASELPFKPGAFDFVFANHVWQYVPDKVKFLREVHRVLKNGGSAMIHALSTRNYGAEHNFIISDENGVTMLGEKMLAHDNQVQITQHPQYPHVRVVHLTKKRKSLHFPGRFSLKHTKLIKYTVTMPGGVWNAMLTSKKSGIVSEYTVKKLPAAEV